MWIKNTNISMIVMWSKRCHSWLTIIFCLIINSYSTIHASNTNIRPLSKLAYAEGFEGDAERRTAAYSNVHEDSSTASTYKSPAEVEFRKKSIENRFATRIAIVDIHSILEHSVAIQSIRKSVDQISEKIRQDLSKKDGELKEIENLLMGKRNSLSESAFEQEFSLFEKKINIAQKEIRDRKVRLEQAHAEGIGKVQEAITKIISTLAEKYNLDLVIPSTQILFAKNSLNITQEVIAELNNKLKHVTIKYE